MAIHTLIRTIYLSTVFRSSLGFSVSFIILQGRYPAVTSDSSTRAHQYQSVMKLVNTVKYLQTMERVSFFTHIDLIPQVIVVVHSTAKKYSTPCCGWSGTHDIYQVKPQQVLLLQLIKNIYYYFLDCKQHILCTH